MEVPASEERRILLFKSKRRIKPCDVKVILVLMIRTDPGVWFDLQRQPRALSKALLITVRGSPKVQTVVTYSLVVGLRL